MKISSHTHGRAWVSVSRVASFIITILALTGQRRDRPVALTQDDTDVQVLTWCGAQNVLAERTDGSFRACTQRATCDQGPQARRVAVAAVAAAVALSSPERGGTQVPALAAGPGLPD